MSSGLLSEWSNSGDWSGLDTASTLPDRLISIGSGAEKNADAFAAYTVDTACRDRGSRRWPFRQGPPTRPRRRKRQDARTRLSRKRMASMFPSPGGHPLHHKLLSYICPDVFQKSYILAGRNRASSWNRGRNPRVGVRRARDPRDPCRSFGPNASIWSNATSARSIIKVARAGTTGDASAAHCTEVQLVSA